MTHWLLLAVIVILVGAAVVGHAVLLPLQRCPGCKNRVAGSGRWSTSGAFNLRCRKCGGTGRRVRPLAKALNKTFGVRLRDKREKK